MTACPRPPMCVRSHECRTCGAPTGEPCRVDPLEATPENLAWAMNRIGTLTKRSEDFAQGNDLMVDAIQRIVRAAVKYGVDEAQVSEAIAYAEMVARDYRTGANLPVVGPPALSPRTGADQ